MENELDTKQLALHSYTFGIYLVAMIAQGIAFALVSHLHSEEHQGHSQHWYEPLVSHGACMGVTLFWILSSLVAQLLLVKIFWRLGTRENIELATEMDDDDLRHSSV